MKVLDVGTMPDCCTPRTPQIAANEAHRLGYSHARMSLWGVVLLVEAKPLELPNPAPTEPPRLSEK